jgi:hypothetical protein
VPGTLQGRRYKGRYRVLYGAGSDFTLLKRKSRRRYSTAYGFLTKEPNLRPWLTQKLRTGDELMILAAPTKRYTDEELNIINTALESSEPVIWLATLKSMMSPAAEQLEQQFNFNITLQDNENLKSTQPYEVHGPKEWTHGIFRISVTKGTPKVQTEGITPIVQLTYGTRHIEDRQWEQREILIDLISVKNVKNSQFYIMAPFDLFDDHALKSLYAQWSDLVKQQMSELILRTVKIAMQDNYLYID